MSNIGKTYRILTATYTAEVSPSTLSEGILCQVTNLIQLFFSLLNGLIGLRFLLRLVQPNQAGSFADVVYSITSPFVSAFQNMTPTLSYQGGQLEFYCFLAIIIYTLLGWALIQVLWLPFTKAK